MLAAGMLATETWSAKVTATTLVLPGNLGASLLKKLACLGPRQVWKTTVERHPPEVVFLW